jgi:DNA end-binding protein Ku
MTSIWTGLISFGLVNIPVKLFPAAKEDTLSFNFLRRGDLCPIQYKKVCRLTGEEVPYDEIVRGYEYQKGDFVVLNEKDFEKADVERSQAIEIELFADEKEIPAEYFEKPYFLVPEKKGQKAYALFREALARAKKVGIGKFVLRNREHLVMLKPEGEAIMLVVMRFGNTLQSAADLQLPKQAVIPKAQLDLALELIHKFEGKFQPKNFKDTYNEKLKHIIDVKKHGKTVHVKKVEFRETEVPDILRKLKASLAATGRHEHSQARHLPH